MSAAGAADVFVIDDDETVRRSTIAVLAAHAVTAVAFDSAEAFLDAADASWTGCVLLDYRMPGMDGLAALPRIRAQCPRLSVVMITAHADVKASVEAMKAGAIDLLEKPWRADALMEVIRRAHRDSHTRAAEETQRQDALARLARLTPRERDVLEELITGAPNKIIAHRLGLSTRTVEFHRARVMAKTEAGSVAELVALAGRVRPV